MIGMRHILTSAWSLLTVIGLTGGNANADTDYFPPRAFVWENPPSGRGDISGSLAAGFSKAFQAMNEPSLWKLSQHDKGAAAFRLLVLPTWEHPHAVRIEKAGTRVTLNLVQLDGAGGYTLGKI